MNYKRQNATFPHQSTGDQIYDEAQFEACRALGEFAAESMFRDELVEGKDVSTVESWFKTLVSALLPDNNEVFRPTEVTASSNISAVDTPSLTQAAQAES